MSELIVRIEESSAAVRVHDVAEGEHGAFLLNEDGEHVGFVPYDNLAYVHPDSEAYVDDEAGRRGTDAPADGDADTPADADFDSDAARDAERPGTTGPDGVEAVSGTPVADDADD
ncbi:hypothetical protein [Halobaculum sp. P14]|uniref:hypothetical protein n=1 Tax=Halobaculum sp. P14 TaxID=3421638 RepID=UPI003EB71C94